MLGIGLPELAVLLVVAAVAMGPDRLPGLAREAAQLVRAIHRLHVGLRDDLRELRPDLADLELHELNPRALVRREISNLIEAGESPAGQTDRGTSTPSTSRPVEAREAP